MRVEGTHLSDCWKKQIELFDALKYLGRGAAFGKAENRT